MLGQRLRSAVRVRIVRLVSAIPLLCQLKIFVTGHHLRTRGIPSPIHEMISRWISLLPPPKVKITAER